MTLKTNAITMQTVSLSFKIYISNVNSKKEKPNLDFSAFWHGTIMLSGYQGRPAWCWNVQQVR